MTNATQRGVHAAPAKPMRNSQCHCGSGIKYKKCCGSLSGQSGATGTAGASPAGDAAEARFRRGVHLLNAGQIQAAKAMLLGAIEQDETHFGAFHALGSALLQNGQFAEAAGILSRAVGLNPRSADAYRDLGAAYDRLTLHEQAIEAYRRAVDLAPRLAEVQHRLGELYVLYSRYEEASHCFDRAADAAPNTTTARLLRSDARMLRSDSVAGEQWARKAIALDPASHAAHGTLGGLLYTQGRFEEAAASFERAVQLDPSAAQCWDGLARCRNYAGAECGLVARMQAVLQRDDLNDAARMTIHFAAGKVCEDGGDYARAMAHFDQANALRARDVTFDRAGFAAQADATIRHFTRNFIASQAASGTQDQTALFIVGMYRSGTTLTEQILSCHPQIQAGGELTVWAPGDIELDQASGRFDADRSHAAVTKYLSALKRIGPSAARVTDKLPFNFFRLGAIHALMPQARIIHCRRDPIDTCLSIYTTLFKSRVGFAARKDDLVFCYRLYLRLMAHWRDVLPAGVMIDVQYERLIADREAETRRLVAFAGLPWDGSCLLPEQNRRTISTSSAWQARQPVYASSVERWRRYEPWLGELRGLLDGVSP